MTFKFINAPLQPRADGKPNRNKDYVNQGWCAAEYGIAIDDCPYIATSTAERLWKKGHRSASE